MRVLKATVSIVLLCLVVWIFNTRIGLMPPIGKVLDPGHGIWKNADPLNTSGTMNITTARPRSDILVNYDKDGIPHIFADDEFDLYYAQGFVTARDRLWQMEMQVRLAAGRLSEVFGRRSLGRDIFYRRLGLASAAEIALDSAMKDPGTRIALEAYSAGVNAYIHQLDPSSCPIEYKLFDCRPQEWNPLSSLLTLKLVGETLTGGESEFNMSNARMCFGREVANELFDQAFQDDEPVIPTSVSLPRVTNSGPARTETPGSNNWAVSGSRSANGFPLLANDPHLKLTLPSIWYQLQMQSPHMSVYGVSVPGIPCVVIGFNRDVAWGMTNAAADVADWYHIEFRDSSMKEYRYNGKWEPAMCRIERYQLANSGVAYDTIVYTRQGPVVYDSRTHVKRDYPRQKGMTEGFALRWTIHEKSNDLKTFYLLNKAKSMDDYRKALTYFSCPAQNFVYAGRDKNIAMVSSGRFPLRNQGQGEFILDGSLSGDEWKGWIPMDHVPWVENPARGFVSSANQVLTGPEYPYYIPGHFSLPYRAQRINDRLSTMCPASVDSLRLLQNDSYSGIAAATLPSLLSRLHPERIRNGEEMVRSLKEWDYTFEKNSTAATVFATWWSELYTAIWKDEMESKHMALTWPDYRKTVYLVVNDTNSHWIDNINTPGKETLGDIADASFQKALYELRRKYGPLGDSWKWGNTHVCSIPYIAGIPSFGIGFAGVSGAPNTINALSDQFGPSWRMVVELGPTVKGYGILPGGQSGNPGSYYYDNLLRNWQEGALHELLFLHTENDAKDHIQYTLILKK